MVFPIYFFTSSLVTLERIKYTIICIGTTILAITLPFTLDVKLAASRADNLFLIAFETQWRGRRVMKTAEEREH